MIAPCEIQPFHPFAPVIRIVRRPCKSQHLRCLRHPVRCGRRGQGQLRCPHSGAGEEGYEMGEGQGSKYLNSAFYAGNARQR